MSVMFDEGGASELSSKGKNDKKIGQTARAKQTSFCSFLVEYTKNSMRKKRKQDADVAVHHETPAQHDTPTKNREKKKKSDQPPALRKRQNHIGIERR